MKNMEKYFKRGKKTWWTILNITGENLSCTWREKIDGKVERREGKIHVENNEKKKEKKEGEEGNAR